MKASGSKLNEDAFIKVLGGPPEAAADEERLGGPPPVLRGAPADAAPL